MTEKTAHDTEAVEALALALADVGGFGPAFRAEPDNGEFAPTRLWCARTAQVLLGRTHANGYELVKVAR